ncbi:hypothetical protein ABIB14_001757 [Arthrobacter sp. UYEF3]
MIPEINIWAVLLAILSSIVAGSVWYTPKVFGNYWMRVAKVAPSGDAKDTLKPNLLALVVSFVSAWVLAGAAAIAQHFYGGDFLANTLVAALILWAGFTSARFITHDAFEGRPAGLTVLNCPRTRAPQGDGSDHRAVRNHRRVMP